MCRPFCLRYFDECLATGADGQGAGFDNATMYCRVYGADIDCLDIQSNPPSLPPTPPPAPFAPPLPPINPPPRPPPEVLEVPMWMMVAGGACGILFVLLILLRLRYAWEAAENAKEARHAAEQADPSIEMFVEGARCYTNREAHSFDGIDPGGGMGALSHRSCGGGSTARPGGCTSRDPYGQQPMSHRGGQYVQSGGAASHRGMTERGGGQSHRLVEPDFVTAARAATPREHRLHQLPHAMQLPAPGYGPPPGGGYGDGGQTHRGPYGEILQGPGPNMSYRDLPHGGGGGYGGGPYDGGGYGGGGYGGGAGGMCAPPQCMPQQQCMPQHCMPPYGYTVPGVALPGGAMPLPECAMPMPMANGSMPMPMNMQMPGGASVPPSPVGMPGMSCTLAGGGGGGYSEQQRIVQEQAAAAAESAVAAAEAAAAAVAATTPQRCWPSPCTANTPFTMHSESSCVSSDTNSVMSDTPARPAYKGGLSAGGGMGGFGRGGGGGNEHLDAFAPNSDDDDWPELPASGASKVHDKETHQCV